MSGNRNVTAEEKILAVKEYLEGKGSLKTIACKYGVAPTPFRKWILKYQACGESAFIRSGHNKSYSFEFKQELINAYLSGKGSFEELAAFYKIPSPDTVREWILKYNSHEKLKSSGTGGHTVMTKGRKTTFDERVEIVQYCIEHEHNYSETASKYQISYQQARNYTLKYETRGVEGLKDNRGQRKSDSEMSELEKLRAENKILRAKKKRAEMEASFLKKLEEIERRRG